ncbi:MAG TPA: hypothetical protein VEV41_23010 [Terriglobales bacterium]|nr:hypothetical protein [Terriglobales bacterium]
MMMPVTGRWDRETWLIAVLASCVAVATFLFYFHHGCILLYGDAVAHINIARRVFDSLTPGLLQLGTVWLPLPHLLMIPFLISLSAWRTGVGGSIPSMAAYVLGVIGIFRLVRGSLSFDAEPELAARLAAWLAVLIYAANPNLMYLQTTAMTESIYLALFVWAIVFFREWLQSVRAADFELPAYASRSLVRCGLCLAGAEFTRYDGWFTGAVLAGAALLAAMREGRISFRGGSERLRRDIRNFLLITAAIPVFWLAYNGIIYRNPLEFATGPYSARAIERRTAEPGFPPHPGSHNVRSATQYFVKSAESNLAEGNWQKAWLVLAIVGTLLTLVLDSRRAPLLLLWIPLSFYTLSIAYGGVPLFVPNWWPFSYYNVRYGIQLLPAAAVFVALALYFLATVARPVPSKIVLGLIGLALVVGSYTSVWRAQPVCFREAWINSRTRLELERQLADKLRQLPSNSTILMYLGDHVGALQDARMPLRRVIHEGNHRTWKQPSDPEGLWERALADPSRYADFVVCIAGDPVWRATQKQNLQAIAQIEVAGQPPATIYRTGRLNQVISRVNHPLLESGMRLAIAVIKSAATG